MKVFKNKLCIKGSKSLLKAFAEELDNMGHVMDEGKYGDFNRLNLVSILIYSEDGYTYGLYGHDSVDYQKINLPQDWDLGLKLASEIEEKTPEYVEWINDIGSGNSGKMCNKESFKKGKIFSTLNDKLPPCGLHDKKENWSKALTEEWYKNSFKPSTKEAYEAQQVVKPKIGKWYTSNLQNKILVCCQEVTEDNAIIGYGIDGSGNWLNDRCVWIGGCFKENAEEVSIEEVNDRLLEYAKINYPIGTRFKSALSALDRSFSVKNQRYYVYRTGDIVVNTSTGASIYHNGNWAEILPNEIKINGYLITKMDQQRVKVGCKTFCINDLKNIHEFIECYGGIYQYDGIMWGNKQVKEVIDEFNKM